MLAVVAFRTLSTTSLQELDFPPLTYDALLIGWEELDLNDDLTFDAGSIQYTADAEAARQAIIDDHNWTINDGGPTESPVSFTEANAGLTGVERSSTSIADVDGDGNQDLLITGRDANDDRTATLYLGDGQGGFSVAGAGLTGVYRGSTSITDVDNDGNQDLLITGRIENFEPVTTLYLGTGRVDLVWPMPA